MRQPDEETLARDSWRLLRQALNHLALPAPDQLKWLGSVMSPDELALDFDNAYQASWQSREAGWITGELSSYLDEIDRLTIDLTKEGPAPWSAEGLHGHPTWEQLRVLARSALALMPPAPWTSSSGN